MATTSTRRKPKYRLGNLVYLMTNGNRYLTLSHTKPQDLTVDCDNGTWAVGGYSEAIGDTSCHLESFNSYAGAIGVFDRTNPKHLEMLIFHAQDYVNSTRRR